MPVTTTDSAVIRLTDGVQTDFTFNFPARAAGDVKVGEIVGQTVVPLLPNTYSVVLANDGSGGTVTISPAPLAGKQLYIYRGTPLTQLVAVSGQTRYDPEVVQGVWDKLTYITQELATALTRAVLAAPGTDPSGLIASLAQAAQDAQDAAANALVSAGVAEAAAIAAQAFDPANFLAKSGNLQGLTDQSTAQSNLGGTTIGKLLFTAASEAAARAVISAQQSNANLTSLAGLTLAAGDILYATGPNTLTKLAKGTTGRVLFAGATAPEWRDRETVTSPVTLSGTPPTEIFSGITETLSYIELWFKGVSLTSTGHLFVQLGDSAYVTSGYDSTGQSNGSGITASSGFIIRIGVAAQAFTGAMILRRIPGTNTWVETYNGMADGLASYLTGAGSVTLSGALTRLRVNASGGNDFDNSGNVYAIYR